MQRLFDNEALPQTLGEPKITYKRVPAETAALIDILIDDESMVKALYASDTLSDYFSEHGIEKLDFGGGEFGITANMLLDVPADVLSKVKFQNGRKFGASRAAEILNVCSESMGEEPFY